jgi:glycerophosphoryl diester phosphodiesterase
MVKPIVIAHRGASGYLPEHTRPSKVLAHIMGADFLEQDIVATRDDELIVVHDIHIDTVTDVAARYPGRERADGRFYARDFDMAEIRTLTAWERMKSDGTAVYPDRYPAQTGHYKIHTFREEMQLVNRLNTATGREAGIYPEIKSPAWHQQEGVDISPMVLEQIHEFHGSTKNDLVYVQCFDDVEVRRLKVELECPWKLVQLIDKTPSSEAATDYDELRQPEGLARTAVIADGIGPHVEHLYVVENGNRESSMLVEQAHELGLTVHPFTFRSDDLPPGFDSLEELVRFCVVDLEVDGLFTDFTDQVIDIIENLEEAS